MSRPPGVLSGTLVLARLFARLDRLRLSVWLLGLAGLWSLWAASMAALYPTEEERVGHARLLADNPVARAIDGPASGSSLGAITMVESFAFMASLAALMSILVVARHTRAAEESGRAEASGSVVVGRHARLTATLLLAVGANAGLAVVAAGGLIAGGLPAAGSLAAGAALGGVGVAFAGVAAVTAQLPASPRAARGLAIAALVLAFALRAVGDAMGRVRPNGTEVVSAWPSWLSPIGWGQQLRPFDQDHWWLLGLFAVCLMGCTVVACALSGRRDNGQGMLPARPGRASAHPLLRSPISLAWRQQRGSLLACGAGLAVVSATFGAIGEEVEEVVATSAEMAEALARLGAPTMVDAWFATTLGWTGALVAAFTVHSLLRMRSEEQRGRLEPMLATAVGRPRWMIGHLACAALVTGALLLLVGLSAGLAFGAAAGDLTAQLPSTVTGALIQVPAVLALAGLVTAVFGLLPRQAPVLAWAGFAIAVTLGPLGRVIDLPSRLQSLSPFSHVPVVADIGPEIWPLVLLLGLGAGLSGLGMWAFTRRDVVR